MTQIRGEQIKDGSIRDRHIASDAAISQSKISQETGGWISQGIVRIVSADPVWDGSQEGELYYNDTYDTLRIGTGTDPYYSDLMGSGTGGDTAGWDGDINVLMGTEASDYDGGTNTATTFVLTTEQAIATDGTNLLVYLNGTLMENAASADYTLDYSTKTITFNYPIYGEDKITGVVYSDASLTNYATKAYLFNTLENAPVSVVPNADATYDLGSSSLRWNNIYAVDGYFSASTIHVGDLGQIRFDTVNNKIQISDDAGNSYADIVKSAPVGEDVDLSAATGQKVVLGSDTAIEVQGDIMPDAGSTRNIGSDAMKFAAIYADELFLSASSLYVNGKKVIEDMSDTMTFQTDVDQAVQLKTTSTSAGAGNGNITLSSENLISATALGGLNFTVGSTVSAKNIQFQNNSTDGSIQFVSNNGTGSGISFTGNATFSDNITVNGDLTISGTTTTVNTTTVNIQDNLIQINSNQTGTPPDTLIGGIEVNRGDEPDYRFVFEELTDTFKIGENGGTQAVATRQDTPITNGVAYWNGTANRIDTVANFTFDGSNLNVPGNVEITGTGWAIFPNRTGLGTVPNLTGDTVQVKGGLAVEGGMKQMLADGTVTNVWYTSGTEDINIVRNFNNVATLMSMRAQAGSPTADDREATVALVRTDDAGNEEFLDLFNNGYHGVSEVEYGIRIQKRGTGEYRDFAIQYHDGVAAVEDVMRVDAVDRSVNFSNDVTIASRRVVTVASGTSFPTGVGLGDECYRTDLDEWYKYNGSVWTQI